MWYREIWTCCCLAGRSKDAPNHVSPFLTISVHNIHLVFCFCIDHSIASSSRLVRVRRPLCYASRSRPGAPHFGLPRWRRGDPRIFCFIWTRKLPSSGPPSQLPSTSLSSQLHIQHGKRWKSFLLRRQRVLLAICRTLPRCCVIVAPYPDTGWQPSYLVFDFVTVLTSAQAFLPEMN